MEDREPTSERLEDAVTTALSSMLFGASAALSYDAGHETAVGAEGTGVSSAWGPGPQGRPARVTVRLGERVAHVLEAGGASALTELLGVLPSAGLRALARLGNTNETPISPAVQRAVRDTVAGEVLAAYLTDRLGGTAGGVVADTIEYLIELSGTRVEAHELTHGVVITDVLRDAPRIELRYPHDLRSAKRAPLLFDGRRSVLVVDPTGRARTELQRHRLGRLGGSAEPATSVDGWIDSGWLVADATRVVGGVGFYVRGDRSIWTFVDGQPLLVRRGEHWTAFPIELASSIANMIGGGPAAALVARTAFMISSQPHGAILAIVDDPADVDRVVSTKDRYDLRAGIDPDAVRAETRLHHLIDAEELDAETLSRLATLDGATILDRRARLIAYGAVVTTHASEHEGARTAAARTLSETAAVVLKVSVDGDITVFREGQLITTLLGPQAGRPDGP